MKKALPYLIALVVIAAGVGVYYSSHTTVPGSLESISTSEAPWAPETDHLRERLSAIHLPALAAEGSALHIHQHLDIFVHGKPVAVPADIGIHDAIPQFIAPIHVHDTTGIIHVESPTVEKFYLGQFFDIWGVRLTDTCLGGYCADATNTLTFYVNGTKYEGDPRQLELTSHEEIVATYGTPSELPNPIPSTFSFPEGY